ncbi:MAG: alanine racemase [Microbacteriaceae bacterium]
MQKNPESRVPGISPLAEAIIDLEAIRHNVRQFRAAVPDKQILAVVKADGFGHGVSQVAQACLDAGATWLGVATPREAIELREAGFLSPILSWLPLLPFASENDYRLLVEQEIDLSVIHIDELDRLALAAAESGKTARVHLKIDTGIHRSGCDLSNWPALCEHAAALERSGALKVIGIWSHLYHGLEADCGLGNQEQSERLVAALGVAREHGLAPEQVHLANSAGTIRLPELGFTMVRVGAGIYGIYREDVNLRYAMTLRSKISALHQINIGEGVGYDHVWQASRPTRLGLVPLGFADGIPRDIQGAEMLVSDAEGNSFRVPLVGRVSMDQCVVDLTDTTAELGAEVLVFGEGTRGEPTADDWAIWANTNQHDIFCGVGKRVQRTYR